MTEYVIVTVATRNRLHTVRALELSIRAAHPDLAFWVCLVEPRTHPVDWVPGVGGVCYPDDLGLPEYRRMVFQYTAFELACALKPFLIRYVQDRLGFDKAIYLDTDIQVYGSLLPVFELLDTHSVVLSSHITAPIPDDGLTPSEIHILTAGVFNAGFIAFNRSAEARAALNWWRDKLIRYCVTDLPSHIFLDQYWLNLFPTLFSGVHIERGAGYNVACWNLHSRTITSQGGQWFVNAEPLVFFHFTGFDSVEPNVLSRHSNRHRLEDVPEIWELTRLYAERLHSCGAEQYLPLEYGFSRLHDGVPIDPLWREAVRIGHPALDEVVDPFDAVGTPDLYDRFEVAARDAALSRAVWRASALTQREQEAGLRTAAAEQRAVLAEQGASAAEQRAVVAEARLQSLRNSPIIGRVLSLYRWLGRIDW